MVLALSLNMVGEDDTNFSHKLLSTNMKTFVQVLITNN